MVEGTHDGENVEFYGSLEEIIELRYTLDSGDCQSVVLFRCRWFDTNSMKGRMKSDGFFKSINHNLYWYKDEPFILATQATKVFYLIAIATELCKNLHIGTCGVWLKNQMMKCPIQKDCHTKMMNV
jgi:hypothetical protein